MHLPFFLRLLLVFIRPRLIRRQTAQSKEMSKAKSSNGNTIHLNNNVTILSSNVLYYVIFKAKSANLFVALVVYVRSVSYTHLDVYKRQT